MIDIILGDIRHTLTKNQRAEIKRRNKQHIPMHAMPRSEVEALEHEASPAPCMEVPRYKEAPEMAPSAVMVPDDARVFPVTRAPEAAKESVDLHDPIGDLRGKFERELSQQAAQIERQEHRIKMLEKAFMNADFLQAVLDACPQLKARYGKHDG